MNQIVSKEQLEQQARRIPGSSQATGIEQSRAVAEVQAAVAVAQRFPRDVARALADIDEACGQRSLAERAFFSFPRGGQVVNGRSIHLAVELARCWGNMNYGIMELERDDEAGHTEMLAFASDLQTNTTSRQTFIVPHTRDTKRGQQRLTDIRDIYENNSNNGARRLRECIFRLLPVYVRDAAERKCRQVLEKGEGDVPMPERIARTFKAFADIGVTKDRVELRTGPSANWTPVELANLKILFTSIKNGETTIDEAFPREGVGDTAERIQQMAKKPDEPKANTELEKQGDGPTETEQSGQEPEQPKGEPFSLSDVFLNGLRADVPKCKTVIDLNARKAEWDKNREAFKEDQAVIDEIDGMFSDRLDALKGGAA